MGLFGNEGGDELDYDPKGDYVTAARVAKIEDVLAEGERVLYMTRGSRIDTEGAGSGTSLFGDDRSEKTGTSGFVRAAFTDDRIVAKIPQFFGSDERSVPYENIVSADLDTGITVKRLSLQTAGPTYHIEAHDPGKDECREIAAFVREQMSALSPQSGGEGSEPDPTEQLQRVKELYDDGVLNESEYEEKREKLLDKI